MPSAPHFGYTSPPAPAPALAPAPATAPPAEGKIRFLADGDLDSEPGHSIPPPPAPGTPRGDTEPAPPHATLPPPPPVSPEYRILREESSPPHAPSTVALTRLEEDASNPARSAFDGLAGGATSLPTGRGTEEGYAGLVRG